MWRVWNEEDTKPESGELPAVHEAWLPREHPLHRPRHGGKQLTALVCALVFFAAPTLGWMFGARATPVENRALAPFPSAAQGWGMFTGLDEWATDHLPIREPAIGAARALSRGLFGESARLGGGGSPRPPVAGGPAPSSEPELDPSVFPDVVRGRQGWLFLGHDVSYKCLPALKLDRVIAGLRRWRSVVEASGREFRLVIAPDKSTVYPEFMPRDFVGEECMKRRRREFWRRVPDATGAFDLRDVLRQVGRRDGRPSYPRIDTHWRHSGALSMTRHLAESLRPGVTDSWRVTPGRTFEHSADIPELVGERLNWRVRSYELAPGGRADNTDFTSSDFHEPLHLESPPGPGMITRPTRMVGDSFSQFASPYLAAGFSDITITHPDNVAEHPRRVGRTLAEGEVVIFELSERFVAGGRYSMLRPEVAEEVGAVLAAHPIR